MASRRRPSAELALRPRIAVGCAEGLTNKQVAPCERVLPPMVGKWRRLFSRRAATAGRRPRVPGDRPPFPVGSVEDLVVTTWSSLANWN